MQRIIIQKVEQSNYSYDIVIDNNIYKDYLATIEDKNTFYIIDSCVHEKYKVFKGLENVYILKASERYKCFDTVISILDFLNRKKAIRGSKLVAIGGGITGDIAGFVASIYMRGIPFIQIPTTYLAMVDSSIGGKTGINFNEIKNNVGSFYQPVKVVVDMAFLDTLSADEFMNGFAESIKIATIADKELFDFICNNVGKIMSRDRDILAHIIYNSCRLKSEIVSEDTLEKGKRKLLNFGHTIAHAIESDSNNSIAHGYAVATGMYYEMLYGYKEDLISEDLFNKFSAILDLFGYSKEYRIVDKDKFISALKSDKKTENAGLTVILTDDNFVGKIISSVDIKKIVSLFSI